MASLSSANALSSSSSSSASLDEYRRLQDAANQISIRANKEKLRSIANAMKAIFPGKESPLAQRIKNKRNFKITNTQDLEKNLNRTRRTIAQREERFTVLRNQNPMEGFEIPPREEYP